MKKISLTQGQSALVDDEDFKYLNKFKWQAFKNKRGVWYAVRCIYHPTTQKTSHIYMHCQIMGFPKKLVDHKNGDGTNNTRENLRIATGSQNVRNSKLRKDNSTGLKGVAFHKHARRFNAQIRFNGKNIHLGYFKEKTDAAIAYDNAAVFYGGEFARTNKMLGLI